MRETPHVSKIKLTSKRRVTFPAKVCQELGVVPGDVLELRAAELDGENVWLLKPAAKPRYKWIDSLKRYACKAGGDHSMEAIRKNVAKGRS